MGHIHEQNRSSRDWAGGAGGSFHLGRSLEQNGTPPLGVLQRMVWPEAPWREQVFMTGAGDFPLPVVWETLSSLTHTNTFGIVIIDHLRFFFILRNVQRKRALAHTNSALWHFSITDDAYVQAALIVNHNLGWKELCHGCFPCKGTLKQHATP